MADQGEEPDAPPPPPHPTLFLDQTQARRAEKKVFENAPPPGGVRHEIRPIRMRHL